MFAVRLSKCHVQFTPLREGLLLCAKRMSNGCYFNSRPYERGFAVFLSDFASISVFQFMPLREGLQCIFVHWKETIISIHAPARGASICVGALPCVFQFQFTPLREGLPWRFQSHPRPHKISIHAPARGASFVIRFKLPVYSFQFTPLREGLPIMM